MPTSSGAVTSDLLHITSDELLKFAKKPEFMSKPFLVQIYNINYTRFTSAKTLRYLFKEPSMSDYPLDLEADAESFIDLKYCTQSNLLSPLLNNYFCGKDAVKSDNCQNNNWNNINNVEMIDVYTRRGILEKIMAFYYEIYDFVVLVSRYNGKLFMIERPQTEEEFQENQGNMHHRRLTQITSVDTTPEVSDGKDDNIFQVGIHEAILGKYKLHYGGRVHEIKFSDKSKNNLSELNNADFVSIKQMWSSIKNKNAKFLRYWLQAYLSNVKELYVAYKDSKGIVTTPLQCIQTRHLPTCCSWQPNVCTTFLSEFLNKVGEVMSEVNSLDTVYEFQFHSGNKKVQYTKKSGVGFIQEYAANIKES
ncbi:uncharacterized protein [Musca autumnalis]|uniref:uncharacterized protein n=1 Tax=Musca autumnalis TaxID=221902 RepID=UPI003CF475D0